MYGVADRLQQGGLVRLGEPRGQTEPPALRVDVATTASTPLTVSSALNFRSCQKRIPGLLGSRRSSLSLLTMRLPRAR
jgi:hypothetical protein